MTVKWKGDDAASNALFQALCDAWNEADCNNGDAGVALLMFFAEISKKNKHFMPIVLRSWSGDKFNPEGAIQ